MASAEVQSTYVTYVHPLHHIVSLLMKSSISNHLRSQNGIMHLFRALVLFLYIYIRFFARKNKNIQQPGFAGGHPPNY